MIAWAFLENSDAAEGYISELQTSSMDLLLVVLVLHQELFISDIDNLKTAKNSKNVQSGPLQGFI